MVKTVILAERTSNARSKHIDLKYESPVT